MRFGKNSPYEVIVCGAGHAGCEAALAAARRGADTLMLSGNIDTIAQMSCNPAIGGLAKGNLVREIDALGGAMGVNTDFTAIQFRLLNASKGPAVQGPRAQADKKAYQYRMKHLLELQPHLSVFQAVVTGLIYEKGRVIGVKTNLDLEFYAKAVIVTTGTFLRGLMHIGTNKNEGGRLGDFSAKTLSASLIEGGIKLERLKTGTPARILGSSIDFSGICEQAGDNYPTLFGFYQSRQDDPRYARLLELLAQKNATKPQNSPLHAIHVPCGTNSGSCDEDGDNLSTTNGQNESSVPNGKESPAGFDFDPKYSDPLFLVEHNHKTAAMFHAEQNKQRLQGWMPGSNQLSCWITHTTAKTAEVVHKNIHRSALYGGEIKGIGPRYCPSIEDKFIKFAEKGEHRIFLEPEGRNTDEWYINGLSTSLPFDVQVDLVQSVKGLEHAQLLRPAYAVEYDFAPPTQLFPSLESRVVENLFTAGQINGTSGYEEAAIQGLIAGINAVAKVRGEEPLVLKRHESYGGVLIDDLVTKGTLEPYRMFTSRAEHRLLLNHGSAELRLAAAAAKYQVVDSQRTKRQLERVGQLQKWVARLESEKIKGGTVAEALRRGEVVAHEELNKVDEELKGEILYQVVYKGYIEREARLIEKMEDLEKVKLPQDIDYLTLPGLRKESALKLNAAKPVNLSQASRISGVNPTDVTILMVAMGKKQA